MSFVPNPTQQKNAASTTTPAAGGGVAGAPDGNEEDLIFKLRTFDLFWVDRMALMYKDGVQKVSCCDSAGFHVVACVYIRLSHAHCTLRLFVYMIVCMFDWLDVQIFDKELRKASIYVKRRSSIPIILRDMAPPEGSIFDPAKRWEEEKVRRRNKSDVPALEDEGAAAKKGANAKKKVSRADVIKEVNAADKQKKDHERDLQKLSNLKSLKALQDTTCETTNGQIHRMVKMLHFAVSDLRQGAVGSSEAEILDILWALEELPTFKTADEEVAQEKAAKKDTKEQEKSDKKAAKKDKKDDKKDDKKKSTKKDDKKDKDKKDDKKPANVVLSAEAVALKNLYKEGGDSRGTYKDSLKYARKLMSSKESLISFQLTDMPDRLPPLSRYNRHFRLEDWQCDVLDAIDNRRSAVVCAPTSSGKTLLSTYTCKIAKGTVLFVLPSEVLVWQVASTYYQFFKGNVTVCTDQITFQEVTGDASVYIGTPKALELSISKVRGIAGDEMRTGDREFMILDGGYKQFDYIVLDEVHTLNGPEGDALQRIIKACNCPILSLSATIGNAEQLRAWFELVRNEQIDEIIYSNDPPKPLPEKENVLLKEHFARFINLQRYVVSESEGKDGKLKQKLVKLHPIAAMTPERLKNEPDLISGLSMTPSDLMDLWKRMRAIFPSTVLEKLDDPEEFFAELVDANKRVTLNQTREYETYLKKRLTALSESHPDLYERLRKAQLPPPLVSKHDVSDMIYGVVDQLKANDLIPAVAFQLDTYGAFNMFKTLLQNLESEQVREFPEYRRELIKIAKEKAQMRKIAAGKASRENAAEAEEEAKQGFVDESLVQEDTTKPHDKYVLTPTGKRLSYNEVEDIIFEMKKSGEKVDINHALIRGLRRGIAIYTNEVGFSCYRRQVQILAQKGRLAVVFSDDALAYGVNMPFRSCVFCGDMGDKLTPLIAHQMQGRAGRRGLDVQGNVIYLGMDWQYIEHLMLGQINQVTGKEPRYPIMTLQYALAISNDPKNAADSEKGTEPGHFVHDDNEEIGPAFANAIRRIAKFQDSFPTVSKDSMKRMCGITLEEFCEGKTSEDYYELSNQVLTELGYTDRKLFLDMDHNVLTMVWELHDYLPEAIHLCAMLEQMYVRFCYNKTKTYKESDLAQNEFLSVLLHTVDRVPAKEGEESLQQLLRVVASDDGRALNEEAIAMWLETEKILQEQRDLIDGLDVPQAEKDKMHLVVPPGTNSKDVGTPIDKGVYEMLISKQKGFTDDQSLERRNELKDRVVRLGHICRIAHNTIQQPHGKYNALEVHFRRMFQNIKYSVSDMMSQITNQDDLTEV
jgi:ATP-dependent RNA helicase DDX60